MPGADSAGPATEEIVERSPDEARSTITAIQQGWQRGRSLFDASGKSSDTLTGTGPVDALTEPSPAAPETSSTAAAEDGAAAATAATNSETRPADTGPSDAEPSDAEQPGEDGTGPGAE
jgi:hypothetical protein